MHSKSAPQGYKLGSPYGVQLEIDLSGHFGFFILTDLYGFITDILITL